MKRILTFALTLILLAPLGAAPSSAQPACAPVAVGADRPLTLAYIPQENPEKLIGDISVISRYLEGELGIPVTGFVTLDQAAAIEALRNCTADVSFSGALPYVMAHELVGARVVLGEVLRGETIYHGRIFVRKDSGIETIEDLRGRSVSFSDPLSESGYLYPLDVLVQAGLLDERDDPQTFFSRVFFSGGYQQSVEAVINGFVDAAGASEYVTVSLRPEQLEQVHWIAESAPIPTHVVMVRGNLDAALTEAFAEAMLQMNEPAYRHLLRHVFSPDGYVRVSDDAFDGVRDLARRYNYLPPKAE